MTDGFPQAGMRNRPNPIVDDPPRQDGIREHLANLRGAQTWIMHPKKQTKSAGQWAFSNSANFPGKVRDMKKQLREIDATVNIMPEYLYEPDRDDEHWETTVSGRALFEYDPNDNGRKVGRFDHGGWRRPAGKWGPRARTF